MSVFKRVLVAGAVAGFLAMSGLFSGSAQAQVPDVNCAALINSPYMCIKNSSRYPVLGLQASSSQTYGANWIMIPGGPIQPGGTAIVKFPVAFGSDCRKFVIINTAAGPHVFPGVDVCRSTTFNVSGW